MTAADGIERARAAAAWAGIRLTAEAEAGLIRFARWLRDEAIPGGGLGPGEGSRIWRRHVADSLLFAGGWRDVEPPQSVIDVGSGVGLPGIPLSLVWPNASVTLLDRSLRRVDLARRAARVVGVGNVEVVVGEARSHDGRGQLVTIRAVASPEEAVALGRGLVTDAGVVVVGLSHGGEPGRGPVPDGAEIIEVPAAVLDSPIRLLRMAAGG